MGDQNLLPAEKILNHITTYAKGKLKWKLDSLDPKYLEKSIEELEDAQKLTDTDRKLRIAFHQELQRASKECDSIIVSNICKGICHLNSFLQKLDSPEKLAWYIIPHQDESIRILHQVNEAHEAIENILHIDIYHRDAKGKKIGLDYKAAELKYKAAKMIYDRKYPTTQKISYTSSDKSKDERVEDLDNKIKLLEEKLKK